MKKSQKNIDRCCDDRYNKDNKTKEGRADAQRYLKNEEGGTDHRKFK